MSDPSWARAVSELIRLEQERIGRTRVVHCYGHGGAGVTLSWGCAAAVAALAGGERDTA